MKTKAQCKGINIQEFNKIIQKKMKIKPRPDDKFIEHQWNELLEKPKKKHIKI